MSYIGTEPKDIRSFGRTQFDYTATQGQTAFTGADDDGKVLAFTTGQINVFVNGILMDESDFTTTGTGTVTLASAANLNDVISIVSFESNIPDNDYVPATGGTFTGNVTHTGAFTSQGIDDNANATAITIDSSENVLIGKTSVGNTSGIELRGSIGYSSFTRDGNFPVTARRLTDDGDIVQFEKDTSVIGSIGSSSSSLTLATGDTGLRFVDAVDAIAPFSATTKLQTDNQTNIGRSSFRFKDLYLSGGAYLGGTGAANKLNDYEEGTWTPAFGQGSITIFANSAFYVKIGKLVTAYCRVTNPTDVTNTGTVTLTGLPFTVNGTYHDSNIGSVWGNRLGSANSFYIYAGSSSTVAAFYYGASGSSGYSPVRYNSLYSDTNMIMRFHYMST